MNFDLSQEQELLQETVRGFVANECPLTRVHEIFDGEDGHDPDLWRSFCELGLGGIQVPELYGGAGLELLDAALVAEVLGETAFPGPFLGHSLACLTLVLAGSEEQRKRWLPSLASGEALGTVAWAEGEEAWQPDQWRLESDVELTGAKRFVPFAAAADLIVVGTAGGGLALVERAAHGVRVEARTGVDRTRPFGDLILEAAGAEPMPADADAAARVRDAGLVLLAADAFGGASRCVEMSVEYAKTREQFGVTIGHFQALKHRLADMAVEVEPARALYWYAAHAFDHIRGESARSAAVAKAHLADRYTQVVRDTVEAHGGIGFTWESDVQLFFKRALFDRAFLGTPEHQRARAAALAGW